MKPCKTCKEFSCGANGSDYVSMRCWSEEGFIRVSADSLPNEAEIVAELRNFAMFYAEATKTDEKKDMDFRAADAIEQLVSKCNQLAEENAKLKAERDAYVQLFSKTDVWKCPFCAHNRQPHRTAFADCDVAGECKNTDELPTHFELRGVKEEEDATN